MLKRLLPKGSSKANKLLYVPIAILRNYRIFFALWAPKKLVADYVELVVTTRCTLNCKYCAALIPFYKHPADVPIDILTQSMSRYLQAVDYVGVIRLLGGEPLLHSELNSVIDSILEFRHKIGRIEIVTNGTLPIKNVQLLSKVNSGDVHIHISNYLASNDALSSQLDCQGIRYFRMKKEPVWFDFGGTKSRNRTKEELGKQFKKCWMDCKNILYGRIYYCPWSSHGQYLGLMKEESRDYIDLLEDDSVESLRLKLQMMYKRKLPVEACNHCNVGTDLLTVVSPAEQF